MSQERLQTMIMQNHCSTMQLPSPISSENLMQSRLGELGLQSAGVGGAGDCLLRSVSHQLYGNSNHHMHIRSAGVQFMRDNPERFIETGAIIGDGDRKRAPLLVLGLAP